MVFVPTLSDREPDADPDVTAVKDPDVPRRTPMVAFAWFLVGVTVIEVVAFVTLAEYEVVDEANVGERVPEEMVNPDKVASVEGVE